MNSKLLISGRKQYIDFLRAIAIILVIFGHSIHGKYYEYYLFTSPIKMPLFFAISGYLFSIRDGNSKSFFLNMFQKLVIPWMFLGILPVLIALPVTGINYSVNYIYSMLIGERYWFMPCLIIGEIILFYMLKYIAKEGLAIFISILFLALSLFLNNINLNSGILNVVKLALGVQPFFILGYIIRKYESFLQNRMSSVSSLTWIFLFYVIVGIVSMYVYPEENLDVHHNYYYSYIICFIMIVVGCVGMFLITSKKESYPSWIIFVGQNTFVIYMWHGKMIQILDTLIARFHIEISNVVLFAVLRTLWACAICCILAMLLNRYCPTLVAKPKKVLSKNI